MNPTGRGPLDEYDERVHSRQLRDDEHQRCMCCVLPSVLQFSQLMTDVGPDIVQSLQDLHDMLIDYRAPKVIHPSIESLTPRRKSLLGSFFSREPSKSTWRKLSSHAPKGLYMYGDVGSGKTMLMDMFYDTLPPNITSKTRIHFHNFMQDVHRNLHRIKMEHGSDLDAIQFVAADIAEKGSVLCFDEFQCTDVADAMILRRYVLEQNVGIVELTRQLA